jgi:hypothetical protein
MKNDGRKISDVIGMPNNEIINGLLHIADGFIGPDEEFCDSDEEGEFDFEVFTLETASARILTLSKLAYFFGVGFFVTNIFWLYNYVD